MAIANPHESGDRHFPKQSEINSYRFTLTPLATQLFSQPTAQHLRQGDIIINFDSRLFFLPDLVPGAVDNEDTAVNFNTGFSWGITDKLQLALQFQHVDSSSPAKQSDFISERTEDNEAAMEVKYRLWQNAEQTQLLSGVVGASWGTRGFKFTGRGTITEINNRDIFVSLAVPFTITENRWQYTIAPTIGFFKEDSAVFFHRLPTDTESSFGTTFGVASAVSYQISSQFLLFGDAFIPLTGNNSINRDSGKPDRAIAYNLGLRYLVNPHLALDLFGSNTFASFAPLSLTADRDFVALGTKLTFMPDFINANRRYGTLSQSKDTTNFTTDGLAFFDGGNVPSGEFLLNFQGGNQGVLTSLRYGFLKDLEGGIYLDYIFGETDESEQGISAKVRLLNQAENEPFTLGLAATAGLTNELLANFSENDSTEFERRGFGKTIPIFTPGGDDGDRGKELIVTTSLPAHYRLNQNLAFWLTPTAAYIQRKGLAIAGFDGGGSFSFNPEWSVLGEVGINLAGEGNAFLGNSLDNVIPWTIALRWKPLGILNRDPSINNSDPKLEFFVTNRVGFSTWHQLRVRDNNEIGFGIGLQLPF
ncbi:MAG: hypothetical protein Tsb0014_03370 [Pleurocapsa sp.]